MRPPFGQQNVPIAWFQDIVRFDWDGYPFVNFRWTVHPDAPHHPDPPSLVGFRREGAAAIMTMIGVSTVPLTGAVESRIASYGLWAIGQPCRIG